MSVVEPEGLPNEASLEEPPSPSPEQAEAPARGPDGRFVPSDERAQKVLDKYGGDVEQAIAASVDAQDLIARQATELGELRSYRQQVEQWQQMQQAQPQYTPEQIYTYADQDPAQATMLAYQQYGRGSVPYEQSLRNWAAMDPEGGINASRFDTAAQLQEYQAQIQPQLQQAGLSSALNQVMAQYPDLAEYGDAIMSEAQASPEIALALRNGSSQSAAKVLETLYLAARGRRDHARNQTHASDAEAVRQQKLNAGVASATAARPTEPGSPDEEQAFKDEFYRVAREMGVMMAEE